MIIKPPTWEQGARFVEWADGQENFSLTDPEVMNLLQACLFDDAEGGLSINQIKELPYPDVLEYWLEIQEFLKPKKKVISDEQPSISVVS